MAFNPDEFLNNYKPAETAPFDPDEFLKTNTRKLTPFTGSEAQTFEKMKAGMSAVAGKTGLKDIAQAEADIKRNNAIAAGLYTPTTEGWMEAPGTKFAELAGGSLPYVVAPVVAAGAASAAFPTSVGLLGAASLAGTGASALQFTGSNLTRQMDEGKSLADTSLQNAALAAIPQAIIERISFGMIPGVRQIFGSTGTKLTEEAALALAQRSIAKKAADYALKTGKLMTAEGITETAQQVLERMQAGLSITDPQARKEYLDSFIGGAVLGGAASIPGSIYESEDAKQKAQEEPPEATAPAIPPPVPPEAGGPQDSAGYTGQAGTPPPGGPTGEPPLYRVPTPPELPAPNQPGLPPPRQELPAPVDENLSVTPVTPNQNVQQNQATNILPEGFEQFEEVQPDGTIKAGIRRIEEAPAKKPFFTKKPNDPALEAEVYDMANQIEALGQKGFADSMRSNVERSGGYTDSKKLDFYRQRLEEYKQQANATPERPQEQWDMAKIQKGAGIKQEDLRRVVKFLPTAPQEVQDQVAKSNKYIQGLVDKINAAGFKLIEVGKTAPQEVQELRSKFSQIAGSTSRYLRDAEHIARNNRYANPESLASTKMLLDQDYEEVDKLLGRTKDTATEWNNLVQPMIETPGFLTSNGKEINLDRFENLPPDLQEKITAIHSQDGKMNMKNMSQFFLKVDQSVKGKQATEEVSKPEEEKFTDIGGKNKMQVREHFIDGEPAFTAYAKNEDGELIHGDSFSSYELAVAWAERNKNKPEKQWSTGDIQDKAAKAEANRQRQEEQRKKASEKETAAAEADALLAERLKTHKETLNAWLPDFGWATEGGKIIRDPETGEVVGRTTWEAKNEYLDSVRDSLGRSFNQIKESVELALANKKLNAKQHIDVNAVMDLFEELEQQFATELTEDEINELFQIAGYEENEAYIENTIYSAPVEEEFVEEGPQAETLELKGQSKAEIEFDEKLAKAEANRKRQEEQRAKAAEAAGEFTLTGSNREADIAAAKGAQDLFAKTELEHNYDKLKENTVTFSSGLTSISDLESGAKAKRDNKLSGIGIDIGELSANGLKKLAQAILDGTRVFVDSGAFSTFRSNFKRGEDKVLDFDDILSNYDEINQAVEDLNDVQDYSYPRPMFVMPDVIGDQAASMALVEKYKNYIKGDADFDVSIPIVPLQKGKLTLAEAYRKIVDIIGTNNFVVGLPSNESAISQDELRAFLEDVQPANVHFLGAAAPKTLTPLLKIVAQTSPNTKVTADASQIRSKILNNVKNGMSRNEAITNALDDFTDPSWDEVFKHYDIRAGAFDNVRFEIAKDIKNGMDRFTAFNKAIDRYSPLKETVPPINVGDNTEYRITKNDTGWSASLVDIDSNKAVITQTWPFKTFGEDGKQKAIDYAKAEAKLAQSYGKKPETKVEEAPVTPETDEEAAYEALQKQAEEEVDAGPIGQALARIENGDFETKAQIKSFVKKLERDGIIEDPSDIYESLSDREQYAEDVIEDVRSALDDVRDDAVQERVDELESEQDIETPVQKVEEPVEKYDEAERKVAENVAKQFGGEIVWQEGDLALIRGYGILNGKPVYIFSKNGNYPRVDIESYTGSFIRLDDLNKLVQIKVQLEKDAETKHKENPFVKFVDGIALSPDITMDVAGVVTEWKKMLGIDANIYISTIEDAAKNRNNFTGPMRAIGAGTLHANERGSALKLPDDSYFVLFTKSTSKTKMLETLSHEFGHVHEKEVYNEQPMDVKFAIKDAFHAWLKTNEGKTAREHILGMRAKTTGQTTTIDETLNSKDLPGYWSRFSEWYADQTARWAMSSAKPVGIVEKYFAKLGAALRKFYNTVKGAGYLPNETFKSYMDKLVSINEKNRNIDDIPFNSIGRSRVAVDDDTNYKVMMSVAEKTRKEIIADYAGLKRRIQTMSRKIADVGSTLQSQKELNEAYKIADVYKEIIKSTEPKNDSADRFVAKAKLEYAAGNISKDVMDVIDFVNKKYPNLLEGLKLSVRMNKGSNAQGRYEPFKQLVSLFKGTDGVTDAETIRHELCHTLEQLMTPAARIALIEEWSKALVAAEAKYVDKRSKEYFEKVKEFLQNPSSKTLEDATDACPDIKNLYQYLNPSEYWAVNAEKLMAAKMGTPWVRFVNSIKKLYEGIKSVFGYDNKYAVHQVFDQVFNGEGSHDKNGALLTNYLFKNGTKLKYASNIKKDNDLMNDYGVPETPSHESESVKEMLTGKFSKMKTKYAQKGQLKDEIEDLFKATGDRALATRIKAVWFGAGLEAEEFKRYNGKIRNAFGEILPSVILKNAMKASYIYAEVIKLGHMQYDSIHENFMAKASKYSMGNVLRLQHELREKLGTALADKVINSYHAAKRARSMQNSYLDAMSRVQQLTDDIKAATDPVLKEKLKTDLEDAKKLLMGLRKAYIQTPNYLCAIDPVNPTVVVDGKRVKNIMFDRDGMPILNDEAVDKLIAQEKDHPQLAEILKNFTSVNHNMLDMMAFSGRISKGMAEKLKAIKDYSPWTRVMDDPITELFGERNVGVNTAGIKHFKLTRTDRELENVIDSMMHNIGTMVRSSTKTYAHVKVAREFATRRPNEIDPKTGKMVRGKIRVYPTEGKTENAVYFPIYANGKKVVVEIPNKAVGEAMIGLAMGPMEYEFQKTLAGFANFTRRSVTFTGYFQAKQVFYDAPTAAWVSGVRNPFKLWGECFASFGTSIANITTDAPDSGTIQILKAAGVGGFQGYFRETSAEFKTRMGIFSGSNYSKVMDLIDKIGDASDFSQREAVYNRVLKESGDPALALLQANDIIDFSRHGSSKVAQFMRQTIPFMQAFSTQMDAFTQAAQGKNLKGKDRADALKQFKKTGLMFAGVVLAYTLMCAQDDDYLKLDDDTKARNFYVPFSKKTFGYPVLIPMHSTAALFWKVMPELLINKLITQGTKNEMDATRLRAVLGRAFVDSMFGPTPIPSAIKAPTEIVFNHDFYTGNRLIPRGLEGLEAAEQYNYNTSELGKFLSAATAIPFTNKRILNPIEADKLGRGWAGSIYAFNEWASNVIFSEDRVAPTPRENPFIGGFIGPEVSRRNENLYYGLREKTEEAYKTYMVKLQKGNTKDTMDYYTENKDLIQAHAYVSAVDQDLKQINKMIKTIGKSEAKGEDGKLYTPEKKREYIDQYLEMKSQLLNNVIQFRKQAGL